ncbi:hypothetical protein, unlikely [Trypanosoma brucei gambiense DAL972]|uniref:Uncharacterized protein n=1 Tax=Trypanosoma brucei gambiense (strain MHOM/CI/86/DAL972) TaxID=679716 RepID=D0A1U6_TRYB9|nr:hypothetical protein, unlikely [Trypanosoma brucei gambiense DAL972]CBH15239.1 hypothetical protein, unlikely [Trypanosoma brucei gambiense DAL972]|eukprot:XP_011777504.1 hypothetical protein, unlikely [Trypanosoma brucei gambiense DAL972]
MGRRSRFFHFLIVSADYYIFFLLILKHSPSAFLLTDWLETRREKSVNLLCSNIFPCSFSFTVLRLMCSLHPSNSLNPCVLCARLLRVPLNCFFYICLCDPFPLDGYRWS